MTYTPEVSRTRNYDILDAAAYVTAHVLDGVQSQLFLDAETFEDYWQRRFGKAAEDPAAKEYQRALRIAKRFMSETYVHKLPDLHKNVFQRGYREGYRSSWAAVARAIMNERYERYTTLGEHEDPQIRQYAAGLLIIIKPHPSDFVIPYEDAGIVPELAEEDLREGRLGALATVIYRSYSAGIHPKMAIRSEKDGLIRVDFNYLRQFQTALFDAYNDQLDLANFLDDKAPGII